MTILNPTLLAELLRRASEEPYGLKIHTTSATALRARLYEVQREVQAPDIMICVPSIPDHIFIARKSQELY